MCSKGWENWESAWCVSDVPLTTAGVGACSKCMLKTVSSPASKEMTGQTILFQILNFVPVSEEGRIAVDSIIPTD
jgi:hypothetical protein